MSAETNKALLQQIFAALAWGDRRPYAAALADDFTWIVPGQHAWSGVWRGRETVARDLLAPLFAQFAGKYTNEAKSFIAEGDRVVVECQGHVKTKAGEAYNNSYCLIYRLRDGKIVELVEYLDSALAERVLTPPKARTA